MQAIPSNTGWRSEPRTSYKGRGFPPQIIAHAAWLYFRFPLSLRLVKEALLERGILVCNETVRVWARKFGPDNVLRLKRKKPSRQAIVGPAFAQARLLSRAHDHRQTRLIRSRPAQGHAERQTSPRQRPQQSRGKIACSGSKTRAGDARLSIMERTSRICRTFSAIGNRLAPPHSRRCANAIHLHRLTAMAKWKSVTLTAA